MNMEKKKDIVYYDRCPVCKKEFKSLSINQLLNIVRMHSQTHKKGGKENVGKEEEGES